MVSWIIAGLGNPGPQYEHTRHNVGFWWLDLLAKNLGVNFSVENKFHGQWVQTHYEQQKVHLLKPLVFMNRSGQSVAALANFYNVPPQQILVVHDDLDLPAGVAKIKRGGGHGGHNGLRDIIARLGSKDFLRCRIGINHPGDSRRVTDYVLSRPSPQDKQNIQIAIDNAIRVLPDILKGDPEKAMHWLHTQKI